MLGVVRYVTRGNEIPILGSAVKSPLTTSKPRKEASVNIIKVLQDRLATLIEDRLASRTDVEAVLAASEEGSNDLFARAKPERVTRL